MHLHIMFALAWLVGTYNNCCLLQWGEVLCSWRDTIAQGSNYCSTPALGSDTGCPGMLFILFYVDEFHASL